MTLKRMGSDHGFTLIEIIVTLVVVAIAGVIFANFMGTGMSRSVRSVEMVQGEAKSEALLERIIADYVQKMNTDSASALSLIKTDIDNRVYGNTAAATYVAFDSNGNEIPDAVGLNRTLKLTLVAAGNDLVVLLTRTRSAGSPAIAF